MTSIDVGYQLGNSVINIRSADDLREVWSSIQNIVLWCNGLKVVTAAQGTKRQSTSVEDESDDDDQKKASKSKKDGAEVEAVVESLIEKLRHIHRDSGYSPMQLRIWAEMHNGGLHPSLEEPPTSSMFVRAGSGQTQVIH